MADTALEKLNNQLQPIYSNLTDLQGVQTNALVKQDDMLDIVDMEQKRLQDKQDTIDKAVEHQKRVIYFNDNSRKVYSAYLNILITFAIILGIVYILRVIQFQFGGYIPELFFTIAAIAVISIGLIIIYNMYRGIKSRDNYNFDELRLKAPRFAPPGSTSSPGSFGFGSFVGCIGSQCCTPPTEETPGTKWNATVGKCQFSPALNNPAITTPAVPTEDEATDDETITTRSPYSGQYIPSLQANEAFETGYSSYK